MAKRITQKKKKPGIKAMKLVAIKQECYAIADVATTSELKRKYQTLSKRRDFRKRKTWEYVLKNLQQDGDWLGIRLSELEEQAAKEQEFAAAEIGTFTFTPERVAMDQAAENDD